MITEKLKHIFLNEAAKHSSQIVQSFLVSAIKSKDMDTIMHTAAMYDAPDLLKSVLAHHNSAPEVYFQALYSATTDGHMQCVQLLWDKSVHSAEDGRRILTQAMFKKHVDVAHYALDKGADPNDKDQVLLCLCAFNQYYELAERLLEKCDCSAALNYLHAEHLCDYHHWQWFDEMIKSRTQKDTLQNALQPIKNTRSTSKM